MKNFDKINLNVFAGYQSIVGSAEVVHTISDTYSQRDYFKRNSKGFMLRINYYFTAGKSKRMEKVNTYFDNDRKWVNVKSLSFILNIMRWIVA